MPSKTKVLVTGGCGFIGCNLVRQLLDDEQFQVLNLDKLVYAGSDATLADWNHSSNYQFQKLDIADRSNVATAVQKFQPDWIMHLAAETHVDRSIDDPAIFVHSNLLGTLSMLEAARDHWNSLDDSRRSSFRFLHVSTDEVYGSLGDDDPAFNESNRYDPQSPYSATKAGADHLVRAWHATYGLPTLITNCSNNYGPWQYPDKLVPLVILKAIHGQPISVYGNGQNVRDWLHVRDHVQALIQVISEGRPGQTFNIGANTERQNIQLVHQLCDALDQQTPPARNPLLRDKKSYRELIEFVPDRPGHDHRYAIDASKINSQLNWQSTTELDQGLAETVDWYLKNRDWWQPIVENEYSLQRLGLIDAS